MCSDTGAIGCLTDDWSALAQEFKDKFRAVVFAILEGRGSARHPIEEKGKFAPFYATFGRWTKVQ